VRGAVGVGDDDPRRALQSREELDPRVGRLARKRLQPPDLGRRSPAARRRRIDADLAQHVEPPTRRQPTAHEPLGVDEQRVGPRRGQRPVAQHGREHVDPVGHELAVEHRVAPTRPARAALGRLHPVGVHSRGLRGGPVAGPHRHARQGITHLARREQVRARPGPPRKRRNPRQDRRFRKSGGRGSNSRPSAWEADALPTELPPRGSAKDSRRLPFVA
jgi:hypothetical protein